MIRFFLGTIAAGAVLLALLSGQIPGLGLNLGPVVCGSPYTVQRGDTLYEIAERAYGSGADYGKIFAANRDRVTNPWWIRTGETLVVPCPDPADTFAERKAQEAALVAAIEGQLGEPAGAVPEAPNPGPRPPDSPPPSSR